MKQPVGKQDDAFVIAERAIEYVTQIIPLIESLEHTQRKTRAEMDVSINGSDDGRRH